MGCIGSGFPDQTPQNTDKILFLGVDECCGKKVLTRQLLQIYPNSYVWKEGEMDAFIKVIHGNYIKGILDAVDGAKKLQLNFQPDNEERLKKLDILQTGVGLNDETILLLNALWEDPIIHTIIENHSELLSITHQVYFWDHRKRVLQPNYVPNDVDYIMIGVWSNSSTLYLDKRFYEFLDIDDQNPEVAKWESVLSESNFSCIMYFVELGELDVKIEDTNKTKFEVSHLLFTELLNSNSTIDIPVFLILKQPDLFEMRMKNQEGFHSFQNMFPHYTGTADGREGMEYIQSLFMDAINGNRNVTTHFLYSLDREYLIVFWRSIMCSLFSEKLLKTHVRT